MAVMKGAVNCQQCDFYGLRLQNGQILRSSLKCCRWSQTITNGSWPLTDWILAYLRSTSHASISVSHRIYYCFVYIKIFSFHWYIPFLPARCRIRDIFIQNWPVFAMRVYAEYREFSSLPFSTSSGLNFNKSMWYWKLVVYSLYYRQNSFKQTRSLGETEKWKLAIFRLIAHRFTSPDSKSEKCQNSKKYFLLENSQYRPDIC